MELWELCQRHDFGMDVFEDRSGTLGLAVFVDGGHHFVIGAKDDEDFLWEAHRILRSPTQKAIFDMRKLRLLDDLSALPAVCDISLIYGAEKSLSVLARDHLGDDVYRELVEHSKAFDSNLKAVRNSKADDANNSLLRLMPPRFIRKLLEMRCLVSMRLLEKAQQEGSENLKRWPELREFAEALQFIELSGVCVDRDLIDRQLDLDEDAAHVRAFFLNLRQLMGEGTFVTTRFNPIGSRTGRIKIDGSAGRTLNSMGIPHGVAREAIVSRFPGGEIVSVDMNASDYRCIVASVDDEQFKKRYENESDFHAVNLDILWGRKNTQHPLLRDAVKQLTYISIYGGSIETAAQKINVSNDKVKKVLERLDRWMTPVHHFREKLCRDAHEKGYVILPDGRQVKTDKGDHAGKILGLYAQAYSSLRFEIALKKICKILKELDGLKSKILFPVHDELVLDVSPDEPDFVDLIKGCLEEHEFGWPMVANVSKGKNYRECTE